jgi:1-aminocyclopropane-1-carboxylate synthase
MASFINEHFNPFLPVTGSQILVSGGVTSIENMLAFSLGDPGDGILVSGPIYGRFELDFGNEAKLKIVYARMEGLDPFDEDIIEQFEKSIVDAEKKRTKIKALLISNPINPLG